MRYKKGLFEPGNSVILAHQVEPGMIVALSKNRYFYVDDTDVEFKNPDMATLYLDSDEDSVHPEILKYTFYNEDDNKISDIPGETGVIAYQRIDGKHNFLD